MRRAPVISHYVRPRLTREPGARDASRPAHPQTRPAELGAEPLGESGGARAPEAPTQSREEDCDAWKASGDLFGQIVKNLGAKHGF